jgi:hypothetical protein
MGPMAVIDVVSFLPVPRTMPPADSAFSFLLVVECIVIVNREPEVAEVSIDSPRAPSPLSMLRLTPLTHILSTLTTLLGKSLKMLLKRDAPQALAIFLAPAVVEPTLLLEGTFSLERFVFTDPPFVFGVCPGLFFSNPLGVFGSESNGSRSLVGVSCCTVF